MSNSQVNQVSLAMYKFVSQFSNMGDAVRFEQAHMDQLSGLDDLDPDYWYKLADLRLEQRVMEITP